MRAEGVLAAMVMAGFEPDEFEVIWRKLSLIVAEYNRANMGGPEKENAG